MLGHKHFLKTGGGKKNNKIKAKEAKVYEHEYINTGLN